MRNLVQDGLVVDLPAPADVTPGTLINVGRIVGVTVTGAVSGAMVPTRLEGVFQGLGGGAQTPGTALYYDTTAEALTATKGTNIPVGHALPDGAVRLVPTV